jgi:glycosyltransferase involved in cell wall biosynthesis
VDRGGVDHALVEAVCALIDRHQIDILHSSEFRSNVIALLARRRRRVLLVATAHGWIANDLRGVVYRLADKAVLRMFDRVLLVSRAMRALVPRWWLPDSRTRVLQNALVLEQYGRGAAARGARDPHSMHFLNVGRLSIEKDQDALLRAFARVAARHPAARLTIAGKGPLEAALRALARSLGIEAKVDFPGYIADMTSLYAQADLVVQSSRTEGMPNVILEAAFLKVPILATDVGGTREVVEHGSSGWLIPPNSESELEQGMESFIARRAEFARMADAAHGKLVREFSFRARTDNLMRHYAELMAERGGRS